MITQQFQEFRHHDPENGVYGDCHRTAMAMVLGLDRDSLPNFGEHFRDMDKWKELEQRVCRELGLFPISIAYTSEGEWADINHVIKFVHKWMAPGAPFILGGFSPGGTNHSVAVREDGVILDPQGRDVPLVGPCDDGNWWVYLFGALPGHTKEVKDDQTWN